MLFLLNNNVAQRTFEIVQKSRSREHGDIINYIHKNVEPTVHKERIATNGVEQKYSTKFLGAFL